MTTSNGYVTREKLFANPVKRRFADEVIDGLGKFRLRSLSAGEIIKYGNESEDKANEGKEGLLLIIYSAVDGDGNQLFTKEDLDWLLEQDAKLIKQLAEACVTHCNIYSNDAKKN